jgi:hypothetical protein
MFRSVLMLTPYYTVLSRDDVFEFVFDMVIVVVLMKLQRVCLVNCSS